MTTTYAGARTLEVEEVLDVYERLDGVRDRFLLLLLLCTGMRIGEAVALDVRDLYTEEGLVRDTIRLRRGMTKGRKRGRDIPVNLTLRRAAMKYLEPGDAFGRDDRPLFLSRQGDAALSNRQARRILTAACNAAGYPRASSHSFRKTAAVLMDNQGIPLRVIRDILGHASVSQTNAYLASVGDDQKRRAVDTLSLPLATLNL